MRKSARSSTERRSFEDYSPSLSHLDSCTAKLQQLLWHLCDFQVTNLLNVAFGFKLSSHFAAWTIPIVSAVIHMRPKLIFRIVCFFVLLTFHCLFVYNFIPHQLHLWMNFDQLVAKNKVEETTIIIYLSQNQWFWWSHRGHISTLDHSNQIFIDDDDREHTCNKKQRSSSGLSSRTQMSLEVGNI